MSDTIYRLLEHHQKLDALLQRARAHRWPDPFELSRLKKLKLAVKDRVSRLLVRGKRRSQAVRPD